MDVCTMLQQNSEASVDGLAKFCGAGKFTEPCEIRLKNGSLRPVLNVYLIDICAMFKQCFEYLGRCSGARCMV